MFQSLPGRFRAIALNTARRSFAAFCLTFRVIRIFSGTVASKTRGNGKSDGFFGVSGRQKPQFTIF